VSGVAVEWRGSGPVLVFLHGIACRGDQWRPVVDLLADEFTCLSVDLPGHGASDRLPSYGVAEVAQAVHEAVTSVTQEPAVYVGHSAGTFSALLCALLAPPTRGVAVVEPGFDMLRFGALARSLAPRLRDPAFRPGTKEFAALLGAGEEPPDVVDFIARTMRYDPDVVLGYWAATLDESVPLEAVQQQVDAVLASLPVPAYVLYGAGDSERERQLSGLIPRVEVESWPGTGHWVYLCDPPRFAQRLREFTAPLA
jgi:pimeloyl-ACP methyl ester carboxylesterase